MLFSICVLKNSPNLIDIVLSFSVFFQACFESSALFGASINVVLNQWSFKLINMSVTHTFWFSVIIKRLSLCRSCQYTYQILNDFFTVYCYIPRPRYNNILYFHNCDDKLRMRYIRDSGNKMFLENSLQCQYFITHNLWGKCNCENYSLRVEVSLESSHHFRETEFKRKETDWLGCLYLHNEQFFESPCQFCNRDQ